MKPWGRSAEEKLEGAKNSPWKEAFKQGCRKIGNWGAHIHIFVLCPINLKSIVFTKSIVFMNVCPPPPPPNYRSSGIPAFKNSKQERGGRENKFMLINNNAVYFWNACLHSRNFLLLIRYDFETFSDWKKNCYKLSAVTRQSSTRVVIRYKIWLQCTNCDYGLQPCRWCYMW